MASTLLRAPIIAESQRKFRLRGKTDPVFQIIELILLVGFLATLYLTANSRGTATTYRISALEAEQTRLERDNAALRLQVSQAQSLDRIQAEATKLGMVPADPKQVMYLDVQVEASTVQRPVGTPTPR